VTGVRRGAEWLWLNQSSAFSLKKPVHRHPYIYQGKLCMFLDSRHSEMASSQEWESPGGVAAALFTRRLLLWFYSFVVRDHSSVA